MQIHVANIAPDVTEAELRRVFADFGKVESVVFGRDEKTGARLSRARVVMPDGDEALAAIESLDGIPLKDQTLTVREIHPVKETVPGSGTEPPEEGF